tara:strand:- start:14 stop:184 length:171 start_codon:yes stop_codon:yes gene_type:complete
MPDMSRLLHARTASGSVFGPRQRLTSQAMTAEAQKDESAGGGMHEGMGAGMGGMGM